MSRSCFAEDGKEMLKDIKRMCTSIVLLIKVLFCDVLVVILIF